MQNEIKAELHPCATDDWKEIYELNADWILNLPDRDEAVRAIIELHMEIDVLQRQFRIPLLYFMDNHAGLVDQHLGVTHRYRKTKDYDTHPHLLVKDLLNFIYCLAGYGPFYICPSDRSRERTDV